MKKAIEISRKIASIICGIILFTACDDFLDELPSKSTRLPVSTLEQLDAIWLNILILRRTNKLHYAGMMTTDFLSHYMMLNRCSFPDQPKSFKAICGTTRI